MRFVIVKNRVAASRKPFGVATALVKARKVQKANGTKEGDEGGCVATIGRSPANKYYCYYLHAEAESF